MDFKRTFLPGDTWFYIKIYCGNVFGNQLLSDILYTILEKSKSSYNAKKWFFIRYSDPQPHIRLRFEIKDFTPLLKDITYCLVKYEQQGVIWNMEISTYRRELERYLPENIETCESLFYNESRMITHLLREEHEGQDYMVIAISIVAFYIENLIVESDERISFLSNGYLEFKKEFEIDKEQLTGLNKKHHKIQQSLRDFDLTNYAKNYAYIEAFITNQKKLVKQLVHKNHVVPSLIHMLVLRLFHSDNRIMECVVYHHLEKLYKTKRAIAK